MKKKYEFNMTSDGQKVFRILLDCLANSGRTANLTEYIEKFPKDGDWYALAATLLDGEVTYYANGSEETKQDIEFLTGACFAEADKADFVFLQEYATPDDMVPQVKCGTFESPHDSATVVIKAGDEADTEVTFHGVGVPPEGRKMMISKREFDWIQKRNLIEWEYPCGIDLLFLRNDGTLFAVSRKAGI